MGLALYPSEPIFVILINLAGVLIGGLLLYGAAQFLTDEAFFSSKKQATLSNVKSKINQYGFLGTLGRYNFINKAKSQNLSMSQLVGILYLDNMK